MNQGLKEKIIQFIKFNIVGLMNTAVDFLVYTLLTEVLGFLYLPAKVVSYACGILNSFFFNSRWTFKKNDQNNKKRFLPFVVVNLVSLGVSLGVMYIMRNVFLVQSDFWCNIVSVPASLIVNFLGNRLFVFKEEK